MDSPAFFVLKIPPPPPPKHTYKKAGKLASDQLIQTH